MNFNPFKRKPLEFDYEETRDCKVCSHVFTGRYCNRCGEKVTEPYERSFQNFLGNLLNAFTFLDGKFLKSLGLLLSRPGQLSRNIADGQRVPYMKMVSLFFVANFFYFLFPVFDSYNSSLYSQMNLMRHSEKATATVNEKIAKEKLDMRDFKRDYENQSTNLSKLLIVVLVFVFAGFLMIINYSKQVYFFDHLLFSLEFYSFSLIVNSIVLPNLFYQVIKLARVAHLDWSLLLDNMLFYLITVIGLAYFLIRGQYNFYKAKWYWIIPKTAILILLLTVSIDLYRMVLFYVTVWLV